MTSFRDRATAVTAVPTCRFFWCRRTPPLRRRTNHSFSEWGLSSFHCCHQKWSVHKAIETFTSIVNTVYVVTLPCYVGYIWNYRRFVKLRRNCFCRPDFVNSRPILVILSLLWLWMNSAQTCQRLARHTLTVLPLYLKKIIMQEWVSHVINSEHIWWEVLQKLYAQILTKTTVHVKMTKSLDISHS